MFFVVDIRMGLLPDLKSAEDLHPLQGGKISKEWQIKSTVDEKILQRYSLIQIILLWGISS
jgi:hypothetical protein